jgi:hypothetical protein
MFKIILNVYFDEFENFGERLILERWDLIYSSKPDSSDCLKVIKCANPHQSCIQTEDLYA